MRERICRLLTIAYFRTNQPVYYFVGGSYVRCRIFWGSHVKLPRGCLSPSMSRLLPICTRPTLLCQLDFCLAHAPRSSLYRSCDTGLVLMLHQPLLSTLTRPCSRRSEIRFAHSCPLASHLALRYRWPRSRIFYSLFNCFHRRPPWVVD